MSVGQGVFVPVLFVHEMHGLFPVTLDMELLVLTKDFVVSAQVSSPYMFSHVTPVFIVYQRLHVRMCVRKSLRNEQHTALCS